MTQTRIPKPVVIVCVALVAVSLVAGVGAAQTANKTVDDVAPFYENTTEPDTNRWLLGVEPNLSGVMMLVGRAGTFVVGGGGTGPGTALLSGVTVMGLGLGTVSRARVGSVAGASLAVGGVFAGTAVGIAPTWMPTIVMFGVGLVLAAVAKRMVS